VQNFGVATPAPALTLVVSGLVVGLAVFFLLLSGGVALYGHGWHWWRREGTVRERRAAARERLNIWGGEGQDDRASVGLMNWQGK
jgi:hypothetical protein